MDANELADKLIGSLTMEYDCDKYMEQAATMLRQQQEQINNLKQWEKRQLDVIESLELQLHTTLTNRNLEKPSVDEFMEKYCTCYKLGYSPLNDYASVKQK
jgi:hypothetical protein